MEETGELTKRCDRRKTTRRRLGLDERRHEQQPRRGGSGDDVCDATAVRPHNQILTLRYHFSL